MKRKKHHVSTGYVIGHILMIILCACCVLPFILLLSASFSDEVELVRTGYRFWPKIFSLDAYIYLWKQAYQIGRAYGITILITIVGTAISLIITSLLAYPLSREDLPHRRLFNFIVFFTMLFSGGLVPTYLFYTQYLHLKNTIWALIIPGLLMNAFNVIIMRSYYANNIPIEIIEAGKVDGASEYQIFGKLILPLSPSILATVGLLVGIAYWNDWFNGMTYITKSSLYSIQNLLNRIIQDAQFMNTMGSSVSVDTSSIPTTSVRMAIAVIGVLPVLVAYPFFQKFFVKGIAIGAVKG